MTNNKQILLLEILKEILWLCISILIAFTIMYPIIRMVHYTMVWLNGLFLVLAFTYFRYAVMLKTVYVLRSKWVRFALFLFNINFFVFVSNKIICFMCFF